MNIIRNISLLLILFTNAAWSIKSFDAVQGANELREEYLGGADQNQDIVIVLDGYFDLNHPDLREVYLTDEFAPLSRHLSDKFYEQKHGPYTKKLSRKDVRKAIKDLAASGDPEITKFLPDMSLSDQLDQKISSWIVSWGLADFFDHGTHVSGILGSENYGMVPGIKIIPVEAMFSGKTANIKPIIEQYKERIVAINISLSVLATAYNIPQDDYSEQIQTLINVAGEYGVPSFVSAGNVGQKFCKKLANEVQDVFDELIGEDNPMVTIVSALKVSSKKCGTLKEKMAGYSNYPDILYKYFVAAPGSDILSDVWGGRTKKMSGTSMATPVTTGAYLLLRDAVAKQLGYGDLTSKDENRQLAIQTLGILKKTARFETYDGKKIVKEKVGKGIIDLNKAAEELESLGVE
jgi:subtilisin family serine protease